MVRAARQPGLWVTKHQQVCWTAIPLPPVGWIHFLFDLPRRFVRALARHDQRVHDIGVCTGSVSLPQWHRLCQPISLADATCAICAIQKCPVLGVHLTALSCVGAVGMVGADVLQQVQAEGRATATCSTSTASSGRKQGLQVEDAVGARFHRCQGRGRSQPMIVLGSRVWVLWVDHLPQGWQGWMGWNGWCRGRRGDGETRVSFRLCCGAREGRRRIRALLGRLPGSRT
jgi:hypothetical protein